MEVSTRGGIRVAAMKIRTEKMGVMMIITDIYFVLTVFHALCIVFYTSVHSNSMR